MGGPGSGYFGPRLGAKRTTDDFPQLDVNVLSRRGALVPRTAHDLRWMRNGQLLATVALSASDDALRATTIRTTINLMIERTRCHFGGTRAWWRCPLCARRAEVLYLTSQWGCRTRLALSYAVCREEPHVRALRHAQKFSERFNGTRMRRHTYECLSREQAALIDAGLCQRSANSPQ
jgi:hypothetical protein